MIKIAIEPGDGWPVLEPGEIRAIVSEAHAHDLRVTVHATQGSAALVAAEARVDELAHMPCHVVSDSVLTELVRREIEIVATLHRIGFLRGYCDAPVEYAARFVEMGGRVLYGSDGPPGIDVAELRLLRQAGLSPEQTLAAATSAAGAVTGIDGLGTLAEGAPADVIAVRGDARRLRDDLAKPLLVVVGGRVVVDPR